MLNAYSFIEAGRGRRRRRRETKFIHHPLRFSGFTGASTVINKRLLQPNKNRAIMINGLINSSGFPKPRSRYSVWPRTILILPPTFAEKVPFFLPQCITRKIPGAVFIDVDLFDEFERKGVVVDLAAEVEAHELFIGGVEAEPWKMGLGVVVVVVHGYVGEPWGTARHCCYWAWGWRRIGGRSFFCLLIYRERPLNIWRSSLRALTAQSRGRFDLVFLSSPKT